MWEDREEDGSPRRPFSERRASQDEPANGEPPDWEPANGEPAHGETPEGEPANGESAKASRPVSRHSSFFYFFSIEFILSEEKTPPVAVEPIAVLLYVHQLQVEEGNKTKSLKFPSPAERLAVWRRFDGRTAGTGPPDHRYCRMLRYEVFRAERGVNTSR